MTAPISITTETELWLTCKARQAAPFEACGFILENDEVVEIHNVSMTPKRSFRMDREQMIEKLSGRAEFITGIWHTHPSGTTTPSHTDLDGIKCGAIQRNWRYFIVTPSGVHEYPTGLYAPQDEGFWGSFAM